VIYGLYNSAAGMLVNEYRQAVLANNLANSDTAGFKRDVPVFAERPLAQDVGERPGRGAPDVAGLSGGLWLGRTYTDYSEGPFRITENPLDVALAGSGFLQVGKGGQRSLTRDGRMMTDAEGRLLSVADGAPVLGRGGQEIRVNPFGGAVSVTREGRVVQDNVNVGELALVDVAPGAPLQKVGEGRLVAPHDALVDAAVEIHSGYVEDSGVEPLRELVDMIASNRAYQLNAQMISLQDQTVGRLIGVIQR
jgi:flagellar basal body rod protein FlgG